MLQATEWKSRIFQGRPLSSIYSFFSTIEENGKLSVSSVGSLSTDVDMDVSENYEWIYPELEVSRILVDLFKEIPQVKSICAQFGDEQIIIWTLLDSYDRQAREQVYHKELEVCRLLGVYDFDFRVTSIDLVSPEELVGTGSHQIYRRQ